MSPIYFCLVLVFVYLVAFVGASAALIEPFGLNVCRLFGNGVKLRQPTAACTEYIVCKNGEISSIETCKTKDFNRNDQKCGYGVGSSNSDSYCKDPCKKTSPLWVTDPKTCEGYYKCVGDSGTQGSCGNGLHFNETLQACIWKDQSSCIGYDICDITPDGVPFKDEANCQQFLTCKKGAITAEICEDGYYDAQRGCVERAEVECDDHPIPYQICGTNKKPIWNKFVNDKVSCRGYYYCRDMGEHDPDLEPLWGQCPEGKFFSFDLQACYTPHATACDRDRCEGRNRTKVLSATKGCQHYWTCENNVKVAEEQCAPGLYFDDDIGECTDQVKTYVACS